MIRAPAGPVVSFGGLLGMMDERSLQIGPEVKLVLAAEQRPRTAGGYAISDLAGLALASGRLDSS